MSPIKNIANRFFGYSVSKNDSVQSFAGVAATSTGTVTAPGNRYIYHFFTAPGTFTVSTEGYVDHFVVGGGGAGSVGFPGPAPTPDLNEGGGGGGGGVNQAYRVFFPAGPYTIVVGPGGTAPGGNGNPSYIIGPSGISSITAGGGIGGDAFGQGGPSGAPQLILGGTRGPTYPLPLGGTFGGGGGGGAGGVGRASVAFTPPGEGGIGGAGLAAFNGDPGVPNVYGVSSPNDPTNSPSFSFPGRVFGYGGGGGGNSSGGIYVTSASGNGGTPVNNGENATTNTGGGGGGTGRAPARTAGSGASGIVIIRIRSF